MGTEGIQQSTKQQSWSGISLSIGM